MGLAILGDVLRDWSAFELDDSIYVVSGGQISLETAVNILPFDPHRKRIHDGQEYLMGIEQVRDVVEGLEEQLHRPALGSERLRAVLHFARHDAFIDPLDAADA